MSGPERPRFVFGTSGSPDYLRDTGERRFFAGLKFPTVGVHDGLHDEGAPPYHLCTRYFPDELGDLPDQEDDGYEASQRDQEPEMG